MRKRLRIAVGPAIASLLAVGVTAAVGADSRVAQNNKTPDFEVTQGNIRVTGGGSFKPKRLSRKRFQPITLNVFGEVETLDGTTPPVLNKVTVDFDKNGKPFSKGIRSCRRRQLEARTTQEVRSRQVCGRSRVGSGTNDVIVDFPDQAPIRSRVKLTAFKTNGGNLLFHTRITDPIVSTVVAKGRITKSPLRGFRTRVITRIPEIADGDGRITSFDLTVGGKRQDTWRHRGKRRKFATARCRNRRLKARAIAEFLDEDRSKLEGDVVERCKVKRKNRRNRQR